MDRARYADARGVKPLSVVPAVVLAVLVAAPSALAVPVPGTFSEQGDAGETPATAQNLTTQIVPSIGGTLDGEDADLYRVCLAGGRSFSATTVGTTQTNTQLFLFDGNGRGIYANNDAAGTEQSTLPAADPLTPDAAGEYLLGVSPADRDPLSAEGPIFNNVAYLVGADGRGAASPVESWDGRPRSAGSYEITLTGTRACRVRGSHDRPAQPSRRRPRGTGQRRGGRLRLQRRGRLGTGVLCGHRGRRRDTRHVDPRHALGDRHGPRRCRQRDHRHGHRRGGRPALQLRRVPLAGGRVPALNRWPAGFPVPIRFSLDGYRGDDVLADGYPQVAEVECGAGETPESGTPARSVWRRGLRYRPSRDRYVYWWKTKRRWAGGCRQFLLRLDDGSLHRAEFRFTRSGWWDSRLG